MPSNEQVPKVFDNGRSADSEIRLDTFDIAARKLQETVSGDTFDDWYAEREYAENIREGKPYFNGPGKITEPAKHSPSQLYQCKRKTVYRQLNAPEESSDPNGIFWIGSTVEEQLVQPFLEEHIMGEDQYITNSLWVDFTVQTSAGELRVKGSTDPVIVDDDANPILPFEVKTKDSVEHLDQPSTHHLAQLHAYLKGLSESYNRDLSRGVILYIGRTNLDARSFSVTFDQDFWDNEIVPWMADVTAYRLEQELPPDTPEYDWECKFCSYKERCGKGERTTEDLPSIGFLPLFEYPRDKVIDHLEVHEEVKLTPTLANLYPELAQEYEVHEWRCRGCDSTFVWDDFNWESSSATPIKCPNCLANDSQRYLSGPLPGAGGWDQ